MNRRSFLGQVAGLAMAAAFGRLDEIVPKPEKGIVVAEIRCESDAYFVWDKKETFERAGSNLVELESGERLFVPSVVILP